ncbi:MULTISPECIES: TRAP transporter small permease [Pseudomonas]|uniref:TRAP transporter small permease protein n=1 Tax=Pseudomonas segetis TaxID=298908 RepID=A0A239ACJ3_9PSED|nr:MULTISPECIES: TRAP transporter small permease [Pseudomonas]SNR93061.1 TRAP-type C4-dicarboxylate transport system, small permease component [Pseudomonas segetis]
MTKIVNLYFSLLKLIIVLCMGVMVVMVFGNVVMRYAFNSGITVSEELSRWLFVLMVFLGALVALRERSHLGLDLIIKKMPAAGRNLFLALGHLMMLLIAWLILSGSWQQAKINLDVAAPASGLSMAWFYGIGVVFGASAIPIITYDLILALRGRLPQGKSEIESTQLPDNEGIKS